MTLSPIKFLIKCRYQQNIHKNWRTCCCKNKYEWLCPTSTKNEGNNEYIR